MTSQVRRCFAWSLLALAASASAVEEPTTPAQIAATHAYRSTPTTDHNKLDALKGPFTSGPEVPQACLTCRNMAGHQVMKSIHWTWEAQSKTTGKTLGTKWAANNFCGSPIPVAGLAHHHHDDHRFRGAWQPCPACLHFAADCSSFEPVLLWWHCSWKDSMTTTSLKIPDALKQRAVSAAQRQGVSTHAFMLNAIEQSVDAAEQRASFVAEALAAEQEMLETGLGYTAIDVHRYIRSRIAGENPAPPEARPWRR